MNKPWAQPDVVKSSKHLPPHINEAKSEGVGENVQVRPHLAFFGYVRPMSDAHTPTATPLSHSQGVAPVYGGMAKN